MSFSRRDFLKFISVSPVLLAGSRLLSGVRRPDGTGNGAPNIVILLFDAFSAQHLSLYGYPRHTTPNIDRFAERASVFHAHHAGGTFTSSGTASLLTGTLPWTHRALQFGGLVARPVIDRNIFAAFGESGYKLGYSQNPWGGNFLYQFRKSLDRILPPSAFNLTGDLFSSGLFGRDPLVSYAAVDSYAVDGELLPSSTLSATLFNLKRRLSRNRYASMYSEEYPNGLPIIFGGGLDVFTLRGLFDGLMGDIDSLPKESALAYYHIYPPHSPVRPSKDFAGKFNDGWKPASKPVHPLGDRIDADIIDKVRQHYDEYVANVDFEFGRLIDHLQANGTLDNAYVVLTSDHGEMHERGQLLHAHSLMYDAAVRIPLIISAPGQKVRRDVYSPTSCIDLLPTLLSLSGRPIPAWAEGRLLPGFGGEERAGEAVYVMDAKTESSSGLLNKISIAMLRGNHKLIYYNYPKYAGKFEHYDLQQDPDEIDDLYSQSNSVAQEMKAELLSTLETVNRPYASRQQGR